MCVTPVSAVVKIHSTGQRSFIASSCYM